MLFAITALIIIILYLLIRGIAKRTAPRYMPPWPVKVYYPDPKKRKKASHSPETKSEAIKEEGKGGEAVNQNISPSGDILSENTSLPPKPSINEVGYPRRVINVSEIINSKFDSPTQYIYAERIPIPDHDEAVYREAERLQIMRANRIAEERNQRYLAQKRYEQYGK